MKILGIDESGRGPVAGPLTICGYLIDEKNISELKNLGVKDSKLLTEKKRSSLAPKLKKLSDDFVILKISAKEIDISSNNLNALEIERMQHIINMFRTDKVVIDAPEVNTVNFSRKIMSKVKNKSIKLVSENYADKKYPEVGAASILAKVERDAEIKKLHKKYGFFGSGYPADEITIRFLKDWVKKNKEFPDFVRKRWFTAKWIKEEREQTSMVKFIGN